MMELRVYDRISIDSKVCHGQACIKGSRIPVHQIVGMLANGGTIESLLKAYSTIEREDILACLEYAAMLAEEQLTPISSLELYDLFTPRFLCPLCELLISLTNTINLFILKT